MKIYRISGGDMAHDVELGYYLHKDAADTLAKAVSKWVDSWYEKQELCEGEIPSQRELWPAYFANAGLKAPWSNMAGCVSVQEIDVCTLK